MPSRCYIVSGPAGPMSGFGGKNVGNGNGGKIRDVQMQTFQKGRYIILLYSLQLYDAAVNCLLWK